MYEIHEIFFELSVPERMLLIAQSREQEREKQFRQQAEKVYDRHVKMHSNEACSVESYCEWCFVYLI